MDNMDQMILQAKQLAATPQGRDLAALLRSLGGGDLDQALEKAAAGDLQQAKAVLSTLMANPAARQLLEQMGGGNGQFGG